MTMIRVSWKACAIAVAAVLLAGYCAAALFSEKRSYGQDGDAYLSALSALTLARHAEYSPSRLPGFPLFERLLSLTADPGDSRKSKVMLAMVSFVNIVFLLFLLVKLKVPRGIASLLCLAAAVFPLYVQNTFVVMDYNLLLFFALAAALVFPEPGAPPVTGALRSFAAGLLVSLAVATRITAALFAVALCLVVLAGKSRGGGRWRHLTAFCAGAVALAPLFYLGVYRLYGIHFLSGYPRHYAPVQLIAENLRVAVRFFGGIIGIAVVAVALLPLARRAAASGAATVPAVPQGIRAFMLFALLNSLFYLLYPYEAAYHLPLWFGLVLFLAARRPKPELWRVLLLALGMAAGCVVSVVPSAASFVKVMPGLVAEELAGQRRQAAMHERLAALSGAASPPALFLSYAAVERGPVWFFGRCSLCSGVIHPACFTFWKSPTDYRYPVYVLNKLVLASPLHLQSPTGREALRRLCGGFGVSRVLVEGEGTTGEERARIAAFFGPGCTVESFSGETGR